jgi:hypothetical protein
MAIIWKQRNHSKSLTSITVAIFISVCCLHKCTKIEELYLEKLSDSSAITPYLLAHILKFLHELKVLALPKQADDDVISIVGLNCPKLECVVLTNTRWFQHTRINYLDLFRDLGKCAIVFMITLPKYYLKIVFQLIVFSSYFSVCQMLVFRGFYAAWSFTLW